VGASWWGLGLSELIHCELLKRLTEIFVLTRDPEKNAMSDDEIVLSE
jgi:hypothetical protein